LNICEQKEKAIFHCQRKKNNPFFVKYFVQKTKRTLLKTSCSKKKHCFFWFTKRKRKTRLWCRTFWLICKILLILFKAKFAYCQKQNREHVPLEEKQARFFLFFSELFSLPSNQNEGSKKQTNKVKSFFFFLSRQQSCCARQWNIFLFHNCSKKTSICCKN